MDERVAVGREQHDRRGARPDDGTVQQGADRDDAGMAAGVDRRLAANVVPLGQAPLRL